MTEEVYLRAAIAEARAAEEFGEVPVGAVIVRDNQIIATGRNRVIADSDPTAHAEIVALRAAGRVLGNYRLEGCDLYTTLEPCAMCAGAILHARIRRLVFGTPDPKAGACGTVLSVLNHPQLNHRVEFTSGLLAAECGTLLTTFFRRRRAFAGITHFASTSNIRPASKAAEDVPVTTKKSTTSRPSAKKASAPSKKAPRKWSAKVDSDSTHPDHGLFKEDAQSIADALFSKKVAPKGPASGMQMLNFYMNRAGKNLTDERRKTLEHAKDLLSGMIADQKPATKRSAPSRATKKTASKKGATQSESRTAAKKPARKHAKAVA